MVDLSTEVQAVYAAKTVLAKQEAFKMMVEKSHAKANTKEKAMKDVMMTYSQTKIDFFATNFMLSGEGRKVL